MQRATTTHSRDYQVSLLFKGQLSDLLVWLPKPYRHLDDALVAYFWHNAFFQLFHRLISRALKVRGPCNIFQHVQQRKFAPHSVAIENAYSDA